MRNSVGWFESVLYLLLLCVGATLFFLDVLQLHSSIAHGLLILFCVAVAVAALIVFASLAIDAREKHKLEGLNRNAPRTTTPLDEARPRERGAHESSSHVRQQGKIRDA